VGTAIPQSNLHRHGHSDARMPLSPTFLVLCTAEESLPCLLVVDQLYTLAGQLTKSAAVCCQSKKTTPRVLRNLDHVFQDYGHFELAAAADSQPHMDGEMISQTGRGSKSIRDEQSWVYPQNLERDPAMVILGRNMMRIHWTWVTCGCDQFVQRNPVVIKPPSAKASWCCNHALSVSQNFGCCAVACDIL
jgi:hypothetical protein